MRLLFFCFLVLFGEKKALSDVAIPTLSSPVMDQVSILSPSTKKHLEDLLQTLHAQGKGLVQMAILITPSLQGEPLEEFSLRVAEKWGLGTKGKDQGLILLLVPQDHLIRFEVGSGLEGSIPDIVAGHIIRKMTPLLKENNFEGALTLAIAEVQKQLNGPAVTADNEEEDNHLIHNIAVLLIVLFVAIILVKRRGNGRGNGGGYTGGTYFGGGFGGTGSGTGGGYSGGGGSFSGGGASGKW